jgi:hypothetical protein
LLYFFRAVDLIPNPSPKEKGTTHKAGRTNSHSVDYLSILLLKHLLKCCLLLLGRRIEDEVKEKALSSKELLSAFIMFNLLVLCCCQVLPSGRI